MEGDKNTNNNKGKAKNFANEEEVNTVQLNKKNYKVGTVNQIEQKKKNQGNNESILI